MKTITSLLSLGLVLCVLLSMASVFAVADFSGEWTLNESASELGEFGARMTAKKLKLTQDATAITLVRINQAGETTANDKLYFDGKDFVTAGRAPGSVKTVSMKIVDDRTLAVHIVTKSETNGTTSELVGNDTWTLSADGKTLMIDVNLISQRGNSKMKTVYTK